MIVGGGGLPAGQVVAAPVDVPAGAALALADVLSGDDEAIGGTPAAAPIEPAAAAPAATIAAAAPVVDLTTLVVQPDAA